MNARHVRIAVMIMVGIAAVGMLVVTVQSVGQVPWWFLLAMALTVVNAVVVTYTLYLQSVRGSGLAIERLDRLSRTLTWAMLAAVVLMLVRVR